jgi:hypothetical protein
MNETPIWFYMQYNIKDRSGITNIIYYIYSQRDRKTCIYGIKKNIDERMNIVSDNGIE